MKRTISVLLVLILALSVLSGCGGGSRSGPIYKDNKVMAMSFKAPEGWVTVDRYSNKNADGSLIEKDISFTFEDDSKLSFAVIPGRVLSDITDTSTLETVKKGSVTFYLINSGTTHAAFAQQGSDLYGISFDTDGDDTKLLDTAMDGVKFGSDTKTTTDDVELGSIKYDTKAGGDICGYTFSRSEDTKGNLVEFVAMWCYGTDANSPDYRFIIDYYKDAEFDDVIDTSKSFVDEKIGGKDAKALKDSGGTIYEYDVQAGKDVYRIINNGKSGWLGVTRSDESKEAFVKFVENIKF